MSKRPFYTSLDQEETGDEDLEDCLHPPEKKRRLTSEQVQFLERSFEAENKLEPERKIQLAKELGLQPRQVAVWFQNRRARWKTKQLERDYDILKSRYEDLKVDYENLLKEKEKLLTEVTYLTDQLQSKDSNNNHGSTKDAGSIEMRGASETICTAKMEEKGSNAGVAAQIWKQEDLISAGTDSSGVVDHDNSHLIDCGHSSVVSNLNATRILEADHSDLSHTEEEEEERAVERKFFSSAYHLLKMEHNLYSDAAVENCNDMFAMEEQLPWWDWSCE
eukprot:TRINITY_DN944_c0_g1_i1.p1 TRINITY_DN944_c0_g1~~TRINITY_DN944_c0_g1_i1.p1  ORF type:complete len:277 (-),score=49.27 TRINITY_DN944_c0_g1_i1:544-1374(-)